MEPLGFKDLVGEMTGQLTTNGYDVLVAYSRSKVNDLLKARADKLGANSQKLGPFELRLTNEDDEPYTKTVNLTVKSPVLSFQGSEEVVLQYDVTGGTTQNEGRASKPLPKGLMIKLTAKLGKVGGTVDASGNFIETSGAVVSPPGHKVDLNPKDKDAAHGVCINMASVVADVEAKKGAGEKAEVLADALSTITTQLKNYFQKAVTTRYFLAGISNSYKKEEGVHLLQPVSFNFTIAGGDSENAALCMWIEVSGGPKNGNAKSATFHPKDNDRLPLVSGSTASVILSHDIVWRLFLKPNLEQALLKMESQPDNSEYVFKAKGQLNTPDYYRAAIDESINEGSIFKTKKQDAISFSPKTPSTFLPGLLNMSTVKFKRGIANSTDSAATIAYTSPQLTIKWSWSFANLAGSGMHRGDSGTVKLTYSWETTGKWTNSIEGDHPNTISLKWKHDATWDIKGEAQENDGFTRFKRCISGQTADSHLPAELTSSSVPGPDVDLKMKSLDYFLTTNLICPVEHLFKAHVIGQDANKGLALPHDLILTGDIVQ